MYLHILFFHTSGKSSFSLYLNPAHEKIILDTDYAEVSHEPERNLGKIQWKRKTSLEEY